MSDFLELIFDTMADTGGMIDPTIADAAADFFSADDAKTVGDVKDAVTDTAKATTETGAFDQSGTTPSLYGDTVQPAQGDSLASVRDPLKGLSPEAVKMISGGLVGGATAAMKAISEKNKRDYERQRDDQKREDVMRRGHIDAFQSGSFTPRGIIGSRMGG
jgi:hypothetical protein